jgi:hypothetical protein
MSGKAQTLPHLSLLGQGGGPVTGEEVQPSLMIQTRLGPSVFPELLNIYPPASGSRAKGLLGIVPN